MVLDRHVGRDRPRIVKNLGVGVFGEPDPRRDTGADAGAHRFRDGSLGVEQIHKRFPVRLGPVQGDDSEPDGRHPAGGEVREPRGIHHRELRTCRLVPAVASPGFGVLGGVLDIALHDPHIDAAAPGPLTNPVRPRAVADDFPIAQELGDAAGREVRTEVGDEVLDDGVAMAAAIAILVRRHVGIARGNNEWRVADDEVKLLPRDRLKHRPAAHLPGLLIEGGVESGVAQSTLGDVGDDDVVAVAG